MVSEGTQNSPLVPPNFVNGVNNLDLLREDIKMLKLNKKVDTARG